MQNYYEELWARLPPAVDPPDWELRRGFLLAAVEPGDRVLDVGSGAGDFTALLAETGAAPVGVDVAGAAICHARARHPGVQFQLMPIEGPLPFADNVFDLVWSSEVIEHVADTAPWLSEIRRVLVPRGRLLLTTPSHGRLRLALGGVQRFSEPLGDHLHLYTRRSLQGLLRAFDFTEVSVRAAGGPPMLRRVLLAKAVR